MPNAVAICQTSPAPGAAPSPELARRWCSNVPSCERSHAAHAAMAAPTGTAGPGGPAAFKAAEPLAPPFSRGLPAWVNREDGTPSLPQFPDCCDGNSGRFHECTLLPSFLNTL